jgi:hypothetical protein
VAVSFSLLQELYKACFNFESVITASKSDIELSNAYIQFSPSLQIFAQYASENAKLLNAIKGSTRQLAEVVPEKVDIVQVLIQPMQHVPLYKNLFQEYLWLSSGTPDYGALETALEMISSQTREVEARIKEEEESWKLLTLQSQCTFPEYTLFSSFQLLVRTSAASVFGGEHLLVLYQSPCQRSLLTGIPSITFA